jgi:hypothetical protein
VTRLKRRASKAATAAPSRAAKHDVTRTGERATRLPSALYATLGLYDNHSLLRHHAEQSFLLRSPSTTTTDLKAEFQLLQRWVLNVRLGSSFCTVLDTNALPQSYTMSSPTRHLTPSKLVKSKITLAEKLQL